MNDPMESSDGDKETAQDEQALPPLPSDQEYLEGELKESREAGKDSGTVS